MLHNFGAVRRLFKQFSTSPQMEFACQLASSNIRYGPNSTSEVGQDFAAMKVKHVAVFVDRFLSKLPPVHNALESLDKSKVKYTSFSNVRVEPNDESFKNAINFMNSSKSSIPFDAVLAVGGGSVMDTAKAANLYYCYPPAEFLDYVNAPVGKGLSPGSNAKLLPIICIPTTAGTGSETTGIAIFDYTAKRSKTGIALGCLKPTLGIIDPNNLKTVPHHVAMCTGLDVFCHSIESFTALPYSARVYSGSPTTRPTYQGSNPIADIWSLTALEMTLTNLVLLSSSSSQQVVEEARCQMMLASTYAGIGFGNAGVHLCHGMSYPVSSQVKASYQSGYPSLDHALVPHGLSVIVNAPAVFEFTASAGVDRHLKVARMIEKHLRSGLKSIQKDSLSGDDVGKALGELIRRFLTTLGIKPGLKQFGYTSSDIPSLVEGSLPQHRVTKLSPRPVGKEELEMLFTEALKE